eukprot:TRINITY_DN383_c0_g1_i1.p2 TRINITY_DN383_c0_g1~~TRINITY_DN383_c0_g1_i1.p2  ORF type:complete len:157 (-),score=31.03 TRINITY_DN383_c0_g1_i1:666-1136(-)
MKRKRDQVLWSAPSELDVDFAGLELLPDEIVELIMLRLPLPAVVAVGACCSRLRHLASSDTVWRSLYQTDFPRGRTSSGELGWRDVYKRAVQSVPKGDFFVPKLSVSQSPILAFDEDRHLLLLHNSSTGMSVVRMDGTLIASIEQHARPVKVLVNR